MRFEGEQGVSQLWTKKFLHGQGVILKNNILYQDNRSAILLESKGNCIKTSFKKLYGITVDTK